MAVDIDEKQNQIFVNMADEKDVDNTIAYLVSKGIVLAGLKCTFKLFILKKRKIILAFIKKYDKILISKYILLN